MGDRDDRGPVSIDDLPSVELEERQLAAYDRPIGIRLLHTDTDSGAEHYLVRYAAGTRGRWHRHTEAHTIVVLEGRLSVNGTEVGPMAYCHFPAGEPMHHAPAGEQDCLFLNLFHGPSDVEVLDGPSV